MRHTRRVHFQYPLADRASCSQAKLSMPLNGYVLSVSSCGSCLLQQSCGANWQRWMMDFQYPLADRASCSERLEHAPAHDGQAFSILLRIVPLAAESSIEQFAAETSLSVSSCGSCLLQPWTASRSLEERVSFQYPLADRASCSSCGVVFPFCILACFQYPLADRASCSNFTAGEAPAIN